jgi:hypothetical protein
MVTKTRRKRSVGTKRIKTAKRRKNNTRSKRGRGHGRGRGGRSAKRGGMRPSAVAAARIGAAAVGHVAATAARNSPNLLFPKSTLHRIITTGPEPDPNKKELVMYGTSYHRSFDDIPRDSAFETAAKEFYDEAADPVKSTDKAVTAFANAEKAAFNEQRNKRFSEHTAPKRSTSNNVFSTPKKKIHPPSSSSFSSSRSNIYKTPDDSTIESRSPPPPDSFGQGTAKSHLQSPSFRRNLAPTLTNPNPYENTGRILDFE